MVLWVSAWSVSLSLVFLGRWLAWFALRFTQVCMGHMASKRWQVGFERPSLLKQSSVVTGGPLATVVEGMLCILSGPSPHTVVQERLSLSCISFSWD